MEITFKGRQTDVPARFREHASAKLSKLEKLDAKTIRIDVEVSVERNPRQASQKERVELTIRSRGPAIRAEAAAEDRFSALDLALAKLDSRLRRALDRRKSHHPPGGPGIPGPRAGGQPEFASSAAESAAAQPGAGQPTAARPADARPAAGRAADARPAAAWSADARPADAESAVMPHSRSELEIEAAEAAPEYAEDGLSDGAVPIDMEGDGPLVVRQKFHRGDPISIDQALLEMELVGHDFYLFHDVDEDMPSVVYRRRGYQYGVIRLVENASGESRTQPGEMTMTRPG